MSVEFARWPWRRWLYTISVVFLAQLVLLLAFAERPRNIRRAPQFRTAINLAVDSWSEEQLAGLPTLTDPTLFALPNLHGFSGAAWLRFAPLEHHFTDWSESPRWLELETAGLGKRFLAFVKTNITTTMLIADKPLPFLPNPPSVLTNGALALHSAIRFEGALAHRPLLQSPPLPSWPHSDILTNTVVQLLVDANGETQLHTLLTSCGAPDADLTALKLATNVRFQPLRQSSGSAPIASELAWGKMIIQWHTIPLVSTNTSPAPP